jgi:hypothetical protein
MDGSIFALFMQVAQVVELVDAADSKSAGGDSMTVRFRPWAFLVGCKAFWRCPDRSTYSDIRLEARPGQNLFRTTNAGVSHDRGPWRRQTPSPYVAYGFSRLPGQDAFRSNETGAGQRPKARAIGNELRRVSGIRWTFLLAATLLLSSVSHAGDGARYIDHWKSLGVSATEIDLIDRLDLKKSKVEMLITSGVSVREYSHRPWEPMGITEDQWIGQLQHGSNVGQLERMYSRDHDAPTIDRPSIIGAVLLPGVAQFREGRPVAGCVLTGLGVSFAALLAVNIAKHEGSAIQIWAPLLAIDMFASGADVWWNHYREQSVTGFSLNLQPRPSGMGAVLAARF